MAFRAEVARVAVGYCNIPISLVDPNREVPGLLLSVAAVSRWHAQAVSVHRCVLLGVSTGNGTSLQQWNRAVEPEPVRLERLHRMVGGNPRVSACHALRAVSEPGGKMEA